MICFVHLDTTKSLNSTGVKHKFMEKILTRKQLKLLQTTLI